MIKLYFLLYYEFLKIGMFAIGGGYATLPFLYHLQSQYNWFSRDELTNMIAIANITPGPVGINMATYTGYTTTNTIFGSLLATTAVITIPFLFVLLTAKLMNKFKECKNINEIFTGLRPAACALLTYIGLDLLITTLKGEAKILDYKAVILFFILMSLFSFFKKRPLLVILIGAIGGILLNIK